MANSSAVRRAEGPNARKRSRGRSLDGQSFIFNEMVFAPPLLRCGLVGMMERGHQRIVTGAGIRQSSKRGGAGATVALLVLLSGATGAWIVATNPVTR